jgi:putative hemolysin
MQLDVNQVVTNRFPAFKERSPRLSQLTVFSLRKLIRESEINEFLSSHNHESGMEFVEAVLDYFNLSYRVSDRSRANIPATGRVVIVANHPLGALDGLALLKMVSDVRKDVKIVANNLLCHIENLQSVLLPVNNMSGRSAKAEIKGIYDALQNEEAVIIFPAGEVSRTKFGFVRDCEWQPSFLNFARKTASPVLPIYVRAKNSTLFYSVSKLNKPLSTVLLPREMFKKRSTELPMHIGEPIPIEQLDLLPLANKQKAQLVRKHLYRLGKKKKAPLIKSEKAIEHPQPRQELKKELKRAQLLGRTGDNQQILLTDYQPDSALMREIGRLRELTFRAVGEGTGRRRDIDKFDVRYKHLILWDEENLEIAGAYRIGEPWRNQGSKDQIYSATLFNYTDQMTPYLEQGIELGRSFVQPKYWGKRSLDYLWYGIGAYLKHHPDVRYMFGPVSLSQAIPHTGKAMLVWYYSHYYGAVENLGTSNAPFKLTDDEQVLIDQLFAKDDPKGDFEQLKSQMKHMGSAIPTLYKQYSEVSEEGGTQFIDFGVDADFGYCVDGLVLVDIEKLKAKKRARYMGSDETKD